MRKKTILIFFILSLPLWMAAQQVGDLVVIDGKSHYVRADPLFRYLSNLSQQEVLDAYIDDFCEPYWPNFTRYWIIKSRVLYLVKIETNDKTVEYPLQRLFPAYDGSPVKATWFSGIMSYRSGDSPVIQLNREYYEEEEVVRIINGIVHERFKVNHRDRWISYAKRMMNQYYPLAVSVPEEPAPESVTEEKREGSVTKPVERVSDSTESPAARHAKSAPKERMVDRLEYAFYMVTHPEEKPSLYFPIIQIRFNADLEGFQPGKAHQALTSYELLEAIAKETGTVLDVRVSDQEVIFEIHETDSEKPASPESVGTNQAISVVQRAGTF